MRIRHREARRVEAAPQRDVFDDSLALTASACLSSFGRWVLRFFLLLGSRHRRPCLEVIGVVNSFGGTHVDVSRGVARGSGLALCFSSRFFFATFFLESFPAALLEGRIRFCQCVSPFGFAILLR